VRQRWVIAISVAAVATIALAGCSSSSAKSASGSGSTVASTSGSGAGSQAPTVKTTNPAIAQSAADLGGMDTLVADAKKEGTLNLIAVPTDWAGYGAIINAFTAKYGIKINSENPDGSSGDEITALKSTKGQDSAPDVVDVGNSYALSGAQEGDFAPYKVATWSDIPATLKDSGGLWYGDYGGYISIGCNATKVTTCPTTIKQLDNPAYKGEVALNGDPTTANAAFLAVWAAALANGGSATNIQPGIDFFKKLNSEGILNKTKATSATRQSGETPIVIDWDYLNVGAGAALKAANVNWTTADPFDGLVSGPSAYYAQAVSINAAHPAAARLWEEFLYSQDTAGGQNGWLRGFARPVELPAMQKNNTADPAALAAIPAVNDPNPFNPTADQVTAAKALVTANWAAAVA
jgi:putative spermidine/putrescine transport system substrate-binding protein